MILKLMRGVTLSICAVLGVATLASAQATSSPFTVLSNNADVANRKLYVEVMYEKSACGDYKAQFRLARKSNPAGDVIPVDSFLNNPGTYETEQSGADKYKSLMRPTAGGYRLRFALPASASLSDSFRICVDAYKMAYRCKGCAAGGSDAIFGPDDIDNACPYKGDDVLACYRRESKEANWEAWIQDPRDCQPYRVVAMPDGRWWFAQNLNYQKDLTMYAASNNGPVVALNAADAGFWCPGGKSFDGSKVSYAPTATPSNPSQQSGGAVACNTYGALYSWTTANSLNGRGEVGVQGICPGGWRMPTDSEWGALLNAVEGCGNPSASSTIAPCNHVRSDMTIGYMGSPASKAALKNTRSCPPHGGQVDSVCAKVNSASWSWRRVSYNAGMNAPLALGNDRYGFSALPAGHRMGSGTNFDQAGVTASFWTAGQSGTSGLSRSIINMDKNPERGQYLKQYGFSVRCVGAEPLNEFFVFPYGNSSTLMLNTEASLQLTCSNLSGYTYTWGISSSDGISTSSSDNTFTLTNASGASGLVVGKKYVVTVTANSTSGGSSLVASKTVEITALPPVELPSIGLSGIYASPNVEADKGVAVKFSTHSNVQPVGAKYVWTAQANTAGAPAWSLGNTTVPVMNTTAPIVSASAVYTITVAVTAPGYKSATASIEYAVSGCSPVVQSTLRDTTVCPGASLTINPGVATGGDGAGYTYQWQTRSTYTQWEDIVSNGGAVSYNVPVPVSPSPVVYYRRKVTVCGTVYYSNEMKVNTYTMPTQGALAAATICPSTAYNLALAAATGGDGKYTYAWEWADAATGPWTAAPNTNNAATYAITNAAITEQGVTKYFRRKATSCNFTHTSVEISVGTAGTVTQTAITQANVCAGASVTITLNAASGGNNSFTYEWQYNTASAAAADVRWTPFSTAGIIDNVSVTAINSSRIIFTAPATAAAYAPYFRRVVTSCGGNVKIEPAGVRGAYTTASLSQAVGTIPQYTCPGVSYTFKPTAGGGSTGGYTYQWQTSADNGATWTDVLGATEANYEITTPAFDQSSPLYRRIVYGCGGSSNTSGKMYVWSANGALTQPSTLSDVSVCPGQKATFTLGAASGTNITTPISYQWQQSADGVAWTDIVGETGQNYTYTTSTTGNTYSPYFRRQAKTCEGAMVHNSVMVRAYAVSVDISGGILEGEYPTPVGSRFALYPQEVTGGADKTYQWQISNDAASWQPVSGGTGEILYLTAPADEGLYSSYYRRKTMACDAEAYSNATRLYVPIGCPYTGMDLVDKSCRKRAEGAQNWEAQVKDARDGMQYRIVQMPGGSWWMAQNLAYRGGKHSCLYDLDMGCQTYGVMYSYPTATGGLNVRSVTVPSGVKGVCPDGWHVPSPMEVRLMLDGAETEGDVNQHTNGCGTPCGTNAGQNLKTSTLCPTGIVPTADNPCWRMVAGVPAGTDYFGFSALPGRYKTGTTYASGSSISQDIALFWTSNVDPTNLYPATNGWWYANAENGTIRWNGGEANMSLPDEMTNAYYTYVRCVADGDRTPPTNSTTPISITASPLSVCRSGDRIILHAVGGVLGAQGEYQWGTGAAVGSNSILGQTADSMVVVPTVTTTYWVRRVDQGGIYTNGVTKQITVTPQPACPYMGLDLVEGTCVQRTSGAQNWEAYIHSGGDGSRANDKARYRIVLMPDSVWWLAENLSYKIGVYCASSRVDINEYGIQYAQTAEVLSSAVCPSGGSWRVPTRYEFARMLDCARGDCNSMTCRNGSCTDATMASRLRSTTGWGGGAYNGEDYWGWAGLPAGYNNCESIGALQDYWTATPNRALWQGTDGSNSGWGVNTWNTNYEYSYSTTNSVRCIYGSSAPLSIQGPDSVMSGGFAVLTAVGAVLTPGAHYQWSTDSAFAAVIVGANSETYTSPAITAATTFWVRVLNSNGVPTEAAKVKVNITATCPYTGADLVAGSCINRTSGMGNFTAKVWSGQTKGRTNDREQYTIVQMPNGTWWFAQDLVYTGANGTLGQWWQNASSPDAQFASRYYTNIERGGDYSTIAQGPCPDGWHVATHNDWVYNLTVFPNNDAGRRAATCPNPNGFTGHIPQTSDPMNTYGLCLQAGSESSNGVWATSTPRLVRYRAGTNNYFVADRGSLNGNTNGYPSLVNSSLPTMTPIRCVQGAGEKIEIPVNPDNMHITVLAGNTATLTHTAVANWYDAAAGGNLLQASSKTYTSTVPVKVWADVGGTRTVGTVTVVYSYTGTEQFVNLPKGTYKFEAWGAQGYKHDTTVHGFGGYTAGRVELTGAQSLYVFVGGQGGQSNSSSLFTGGWNGGGHTGATNSGVAGGGGATDFRLTNGTFDNLTSLMSRIMVAGGGGGAGANTNEEGYAAGCPGGSGGGLQGGLTVRCNSSYPVNANSYTRQTSSGALPHTVCSSRTGRFGLGGAQAGDAKSTNCWGGGGGGGWYGGYGGGGTGGNGGSSYISGHEGCIAIESATACTGATTGVACIHKAGCTEGAASTVECATHYSNIAFTSTVMIDGEGHAWTTAKGELIDMPKPLGGTYPSGFGHVGNGMAKITPQ